MDQLKNYLLRILERCSDDPFGQEALEWAITSGRVQLTLNLTADLHHLLDDGGYQRILEEYQKHLQTSVGQSIAA